MAAAPSAAGRVLLGAVPIEYLLDGPLELGEEFVPSLLRVYPEIRILLGAPIDLRRVQAGGLWLVSEVDLEVAGAVQDIRGDLP